ncbi:MAG: hypothetical protein M1541_20730 [Acidobacteria bacterium]|nr:hypothetical protein [Acidobacteriota bacterium]
MTQEGEAGGLAVSPRLSAQTGRRRVMSIFTNAGHVSREALSLQAMDDLPGSWIVPVVKHLSFCSRCRAELMEIEQLIAALRMLAQSSLPKNSRASMVN